MKTKAFKTAVPYTLPICIGFLFLGISYGFLMRNKGFSVWYTLFMSMFIFAGSMECVMNPSTKLYGHSTGRCGSGMVHVFRHTFKSSVLGMRSNRWLTTRLYNSF